MPAKVTGPNGARTNGTAPPDSGAAIRSATNNPTPAGAGGTAPPGTTAAAGAATATATGVISHRKATGVELLVSLEATGWC
jgi:hypothetical protein